MRTHQPTRARANNQCAANASGPSCPHPPSFGECGDMGTAPPLTIADKLFVGKAL